MYRFGIELLFDVGSRALILHVPLSMSKSMRTGWAGSAAAEVSRDTGRPRRQ